MELTSYLSTFPAGDRSTLTPAWNTTHTTSDYPRAKLKFLQCQISFRMCSTFQKSQQRTRRLTDPERLMWDKAPEAAVEQLREDLQDFWLFSDLNHQGCQHGINCVLLCIWLKSSAAVFGASQQKCHTCFTLQSPSSLNK